MSTVKKNRENRERRIHICIFYLHINLEIVDHTIIILFLFVLVLKRTIYTYRYINKRI